MLPGTPKRGPHRDWPSATEGIQAGAGGAQTARLAWPQLWALPHCTPTSQQGIVPHPTPTGTHIWDTSCCAFLRGVSVPRKWSPQLAARGSLPLHALELRKEEPQNHLL